ncbi:DUF4407 domain-containing protein [Bradyrhizobium sp. Ec3.3]|uniref:DUF4407 domain-containing protein n=1 Tax=Bradyrhizobium sp. Ec3.3 TaxID=189753 RepID=UPI00040DA7B6|nr:DUF4407 domain-containing protein [Bradyrhizobium sp. Ec3.3]
MKALLNLPYRVSAYDDDKQIAECSPGERNTAIARGLLFLLYVVLLAIVLTFIGHNLLRSSPSLAITLLAILLAIYIGLIDHYAFIRAAVFPDGMRQLLHGGFGVNVPLGSDSVSRACKSIRVFLMGLLALVLANFIGLFLNDQAIGVLETKQHYVQNASAAQKAMKDEDGKHARALKEYDQALAVMNTLSPEVDRLLKQTNRKASDATTSKLAANESRLTQARAALDEKRRVLETLDASRASNVEMAIQASPDFVPRDDSLVTRIKLLFSLIHSDWWTAVPTLMIDGFIFGCDAAIVVLKHIAVPSTYSMAEARRHLRAMVQQARLAEADAAADGEPAPPEAPTPSPQPAPARRGPGRPRKNGFDHTAGAVQ